MGLPRSTDVIGDVPHGQAFGFLQGGFDFDGSRPSSAMHPAVEPDLETLRSVAPEHLWSPRSGDAGADVWTTGITLYRVLTGRFPFDADSVSELRGRIAGGSFVPLGRLRPDVPCGLADVIHRCLERDPTLRYRNASELAVALVQYSSLLTPGASSPQPPRTSWVSAKVAAVLLGIGLVLSIALGLVLVSGEKAVTTRPARVHTPDVVAVVHASDAITAKAPPPPAKPRLLTATDVLGY